MANGGNLSSTTVNNAPRPAIKVFVATTVMLSFISFWRAAAIVLSDLASSAYYVGGDAENVIGKSAPWFVLAVMLFSYAVRSLYIESSSMFVRGGVYRVVLEAMGGTLAKLSVSALLFDYVLTGPISAVSAGQYLAGFIEDLSARLGHRIDMGGWHGNYFAAAFGVLVTVYFWWKNVQGMHESSQKALRIMQVTTVMVVILIVWCLFTIAVHPETRHLPPMPTHQSILAANQASHGDTLGWLAHFPVITMLPFVLMLVGFGHSVLAMSGEESLAQVNREIEHPKLKNLEKAGAVIFLYSLLFTSLVSFFAVMIIPDAKRPEYFANLISGLAMYMAGPYNLRLIFQGFVVLVGVLILSGAVNTAIVGANGVLNRISEDGVLTPWFRKPHSKYGTSYRLINLITFLQCFTIIASRGNVYLLAALYAFGVIWSFAFKALAVFVLRFKEPGKREFRVPGNLQIGSLEIPIGLALITVLLFATAVVNLFTKPLATIAGVSFSIFLFAVFTASEKITHRERGARHELREEFRVAEQPLVDREEMRVRPGNVLVAIRDPRNLYYLNELLAKTDIAKQDVIVMTARIYHREHSYTGSTEYDSAELFEVYEQQLFTKVVELAEKQGKPVSLMVVPSANVFDAIVQTGARLESARVVCGLSNRLTLDEQGKLTGDAWERLPEPRPNMSLEIHAPDGSVHEYYLGPHTPRLREQDLDLLHKLWLEVSEKPEYSSVHHYHIVAMALEQLQHVLHGPEGEKLLAKLKDKLHDGEEN
ncbi:MAG TPA: APC family permease [Candidatus Acidoferrales bacterium]|nr:APC family permease [Candidatus Acidoferrales bacterium]